MPSTHTWRADTGRTTTQLRPRLMVNPGYSTLFHPTPVFFTLPPAGFCQAQAPVPIPVRVRSHSGLSTVVSSTPAGSIPSVRISIAAPSTAPVSVASSTTLGSRAPIPAPSSTPVAPAPAASVRSSRSSRQKEKGIKTLAPTAFTVLHVIQNVKVWNKEARKYRVKGKGFACRAFRVGTGKKVGDLIRDLMEEYGVGRIEEEEEEEDEGESEKVVWGVTEVLELGDGTFGKDATIKFGSADANCTLAEVGWTSVRGEERPPVWLVLHCE